MSSQEGVLQRPIHLAIPVPLSNIQGKNFFFLRFHASLWSSQDFTESMKWRQSWAAGSILTSSEKCRTVNYIYRQQQEGVRAPRILSLNSWLDVGLWRKLSNLLQGGVRAPNLYYCCHQCSKNLRRMWLLLQAASAGTKPVQQRSTKPLPHHDITKHTPSCHCLVTSLERV